MSSSKRKRSKSGKAKAAPLASSDGPKFVPPINIGKKPLKPGERRKSFSLPLNALAKDRAKRSQSSGHGRSDHDRWHMALIQASSSVSSAEKAEDSVHSFMSPFQWSFLSEHSAKKVDQGELLTDRSARRRGQPDVKLNFMMLSDLHINQRTFNPALFQTWHDEMAAKVQKRKQEVLNQKPALDKREGTGEDASPRMLPGARIGPHQSPAVPRSTRTPRMAPTTKGGFARREAPENEIRLDSYHGASELERSFQHLKIQINPIKLLKRGERDNFKKNWAIYHSNETCAPARVHLQRIAAALVNEQVRKKPSPAECKKYLRALELRDPTPERDRPPETRALRFKAEEAPATRGRSQSTSSVAAPAPTMGKPGVPYMKLVHVPEASDSEELISQRTARALQRSERPVMEGQVHFNPLMLMQTTPDARKKLYTALIRCGLRVPKSLQKQVERDSKAAYDSPRTSLPSRLKSSLPLGRSFSITHGSSLRSSANKMHLKLPTKSSSVDNASPGRATTPDPPASAGSDSPPRSARRPRTPPSSRRSVVKGQIRPARSPGRSERSSVVLDRPDSLTASMSSDSLLSPTRQTALRRADSDGAARSSAAGDGGDSEGSDGARSERTATREDASDGDSRVDGGDVAGRDGKGDSGERRKEGVSPAPGEQKRGSWLARGPSDGSSPRTGSPVLRSCSPTPRSGSPTPRSGSPKARSGSPTSQLSGSPKKVRTGSPKKIRSDSPKKGRSDSPKKGRSDSPKKGLSDSPKKGRSDSPTARTPSPSAQACSPEKQRAGSPGARSGSVSPALLASGACSEQGNADAHAAGGAVKAVRPVAVRAESAGKATVSPGASAAEGVAEPDGSPGKNEGKPELSELSSQRRVSTLASRFASSDKLDRPQDSERPAFKVEGRAKGFEAFLGKN